MTRMGGGCQIGFYWNVDFILGFCNIKFNCHVGFDFLRHGLLNEDVSIDFDVYFILYWKLLF